MTNDFDRSCGKLASALTAYFDGQATPAEARYARAHLGECESCAELWLAWHHARVLLAGDVISAPPHLAQRILMACRMDALRRVGGSRSTANPTPALPPEVVAMRLGLQSFDNFREDECAVEPPAHLMDAILSRTTRSAEALATAQEELADWNPQTPIFQDASLTPLVRERGFSPVATLRRTFAFAAPALFLWMMWPGGGSSFAPQQGDVATDIVLRQAEPQPAVMRAAAPRAARLLKAASSRGVEATAHAPAVAVADEQPHEPIAVRAAQPDSQPEDTRFEESGRFAETRAAATARRSPVAETREREAEEEHAARPAVRVASLPAASPALQPRTGFTARMARFTTGLRTSAPRMLTTVSFAPAALRSAAVISGASEAPRREVRTTAPVETRTSVETESSDSDSSLDGRLMAVSAIDSYRAALAEDVDTAETES